MESFILVTLFFGVPFGGFTLYLLHSELGGFSWRKVRDNAGAAAGLGAFFLCIVAICVYALFD